MTVDDLKAIADGFYKKFIKLPDNFARLNQQFPLAVFGTLRKGYGNDKRFLLRHPPLFHQRAFLPHFYASNLTLCSAKDATAPIEIYYHDPQYWESLIRGVDGLEGFSVHGSYGGYIRTLVKVKVLPADYDHEDFRCDLWNKRDLKIDKETWSQYPEIPCWVYSNYQSNRALHDVDDSPILWYR